MNFDSLKEYINSLSDLNVKSADISIMQNRKEIFRYTYGWSDYECIVPTKRNDIRWMFSMSKVITVIAFMRLVEKGLVSLDDKVSKYLPEYENMTVAVNDEVVPAKNDMLIWHLLSMRSGLDYNIFAKEIRAAASKTNATTRSVVASFAKRPLMFEPGTAYQYSLSHDVLAAIAEVVTGKSYSSYLHDELFAPLNLKDIGFFPTRKQQHRFSALYRYDATEKTCVNTKMINEYLLFPGYESGGAGLFSTVDDYITIIDALSNGGKAYNGYHILSQETIDEIRKDRLNGDKFNRPGYGYGLGVRTMIDKKAGNSLSPIGEFGWDGAAASYCLMDTENHLTAVLALHIRDFSYSYDVIHPTVRNLIYEGLNKQ